MSGRRNQTRPQVKLRRAASWLIGLLVCAFAGRSVAQAPSLGTLVDRATAAQTAGDYGQAANLYRRATAISPRTAELWSNLGIMEFFNQQPDPAAMDLHHALKLNPDLVAPLLFLGKISLGKKTPSEALSYLLRAQALQPQDAEVLRSLGSAYEALQRLPEAAAVYRSATEAAPSDAKAWLGLGSSSLELIAVDGHTLASRAPNSPWARALYADELLAQGRPLEASDTYHAVLGSSTPEENAVLARMLQHMQADQAQFPMASKSQAALQQLVAETQTLRLGPAQDAVTCPKQSKRTTASSASSLVTGAACAFLGDHDAESAALAQRALRLAPENAEALYWSVKANERVAVQALARVDDLAPNSAVTHDLVGDLFRYQQQWDNAIGEYNKALALNSHDAAALLGAATCLFSLSQYDQATVTLQRALADRPLDPKSNLLMAEILNAGGHEDQAVPYLAKCTEVAPELQPRVHYLYGRAAAKAGNLQEAIRQLVQALPSDTDGSIHFQLSRLYRRTGDVAKAQIAEAEAKTLVNRREANAGTALRESQANTP